jgi:hypothetical protein
MHPTDAIVNNGGIKPPQYSDPSRMADLWQFLHDGTLPSHSNDAKSFCSALPSIITWTIRSSIDMAVSMDGSLLRFPPAYVTTNELMASVHDLTPLSLPS